MRASIFVAAAGIAVSLCGCSIASLPTLPTFGSFTGSKPKAGAVSETRSLDGRPAFDLVPGSVATPASRAGSSGASATGAGTSSTGGSGGSVGPVYRRSYALVIGNDAYTRWPALGQAVADSAAVKRALEAHGYEVTHHVNLSGRELKDALDDFFIARGAEKDAGLLLWYAGHGHTINGEGYLVPVDAADPRNSDVEFRKQAFSMREFGRLMREARSNHVLAVFDSCFAGTVFKTARSGMPPAVEHALRYPVRQFIAAGDHTQKVADDGLFQKTFVDAMMGRDPHVDHDRDGFVSGEELGIFMSNKLLNVTSGRQKPTFGKLSEGDFDRGDFVFRVGASAVSAAGQSMPASYAPVPRSPSRDPSSFARGVRIYVAPLVGAPGDGNTALRDALSKRLMASGYEVTDYPVENTVRIHGVVSKRSIGVLADELVLRWQVFNSNGAPLGGVEDNIEAFSGSYDGSWGERAEAAAGKVGDRLAKFLSRPI